jgi:carboxyl-terminal processing protease
MKKVPASLLILLFTFMGFFLGYLTGQAPGAPIQFFNRVALDEATAVTMQPFLEVWDLVQNEYFEQPVDQERLVEGAINGMLTTLDDQHTVYLSPEEQEMATRSFSGEYTGIGAEVESVDGNITIVSPIDGSPAQAADLRPGDILRAADGVVLTGMDVTEAAALVRGEAGTAVLLTIERAGEQFDIEIIRDVVKLVSASGRMLDNNIAYLRLSRFAEQTDEEMNAVLEELLANNPEGLVLDLRRNPGGALDTTVKIADQFLADGTALIERFGDGEERIFTTNDGDSVEEIPLVVLIDEGSASASEVLAGAIQDRERAILIGQTSYGKGTVQTWRTLSNEGGIRLTIAQWLTPNDVSIHKAGLTPDFFIPMAEPIEGEAFTDTQLQAAIDYLLGKTIVSVPPEPDAPEAETP